MPIVLDDSAWPVLFHTMGAHSLENFERFTGWYAAHLARAQQTNTRLVVVSDLRGVVSSAEVRRAAARWIASLTPHQREWCAASVLILDSPVVRASITALNWFQRPTSPQHVVADPIAAWDHVAFTLRQHQLSVPPVPQWCHP